VSPERRDNRLGEGRLDVVIERLPDGILIVDGDGMILFANPAAEQLFGRSERELRGAPLGFPVVSGDKTEIQLLGRNGAAVTVELRVVETEWSDAPAYIVSLRDVSERKRAEAQSAELERERLARAKAEAANQAKSDFLTLMSHELRTPLNAVIGYADLLDLGIGGTLGPVHQQHISRIRDSGRHLLGLVNELLDLGRVQTGTLGVRRGVGRAQSTMSEAVAIVRPAAEQRHIEITVVPPPDTDAMYCGDPDRVRQILVNVLDNAVKFTSTGGRVRVEWGTRDDREETARLVGPGPWFVARVVDTGIGMPPDMVARIFDPFVQVESSHTRTKEGAGLGLSISRRLARLMDGDLTATSAPGRGSAFTLWLRAPEAANESTGGESTDYEALHAVAGYAEVGGILLRQIDDILDGFVARLREEGITERVSALSDADLADHLGTFIANIAGLFTAIAAGPTRSTTLLPDASYLQSTIADRHGAQRGDLGWTASAMRREWAILCDEIEAALRRNRGSLSDRTMSEVSMIIERLVEQAVETSCRAIGER
jgi:signal transduction histidine kinase